MVCRMITPVVPVLIRCLLGLTGLVLATVLVPQPARAAPDPVAQVARHLAGITTMRAQFRQIAANGKVTAGTMLLARPGKIRFDYGKTAPLLIVANGARLSMVDYKVAQVQVWPVRDTPLAVLLDPKFDLRAYLRPAAGVPGQAEVAVEASDPKRPQFGSTVLYFAAAAGAPGGLRLLGWRVLDVQGNETLVELTDTRFNQPIPDAAFTFRDPRASRRGAPGKL